MAEIAYHELGNVQRTMVIPLWARAEESRKRNPILHDERAVEILDKLQYDTTGLAREGQLIALIPVVAATIFDRFTREFLKEHPDGTIVEIGTGLDTRYDRLDNGRAMWFEIDLPDSIAMRRRFFEETPRRKFVAGSILERDWIDVVKSRGESPTLFLAEGVLLYFEEEQVKFLFSTIADEFPGSRFVTDSMVRGAVKNSHKFKVCQLGGANFKWGIDDIHEVESWDPRFRVLDRDGVMNHHRSRWGLGLRLATWIMPGLRKISTINLIQLG